MALSFYVPCFKIACEKVSPQYLLSTASAIAIVGWEVRTIDGYLLFIQCLRRSCANALFNWA